MQKPILLQLEREGHVDLPGVIEIQPRSMRSLPSPYTALKPKPEPESNPEQKADRFALEKLEKEKIASILFPRVEDAPKWIVYFQLSEPKLHTDSNLVIYLTFAI